MLAETARSCTDVGRRVNGERTRAAVLPRPRSRANGDGMGRGGEGERGGMEWRVGRAPWAAAVRVEHSKRALAWDRGSKTRPRRANDAARGRMKSTAVWISGAHKGEGVGAPRTSGAKLDSSSACKTILHQ